MGRACLHVTYMRSLQLHMQIGGSVLLVTVSDVSHVHDWNEVCLIGSRKINMEGRFQMVAEDAIITMECQSDPCPPLWPNHCMHVSKFYHLHVSRGSTPQVLIAPINGWDIP